MLYVLLLLSGFPTRILTAYINYHEQVTMHFAFAGFLGSGHHHKCGIPQGCPFSMAFVALMLRPWHALMLTIKVVPRTLADDLLFLTYGGDSLLCFSVAFDETCMYIHNLLQQDRI